MTELSTENVLHPRQVTELRESRAQLEVMLSAPPHIRSQLQDGGAHVQNQVKGIDAMLSQAAKPIPAEEIDSAVQQEQDLREKWLNGMPTQAEMRRNPSGAVDKHRAWEKRSKVKVLEWKNLRRRLHASGISHHGLPDEGDISNVEMYRPVGGSQELNMHGEQIEGKIIHLSPPGAGPVAMMSDDQANLLKSINPDLYAKMATLSNEERANVLEVVDHVAGLEKEEELSKEPKPKHWEETDIQKLRRECKHLGIKTGAKSKVWMRDEIAKVKEA